MKTNTARNLRVGLFVTLGLAAAAVIIFFLGDIQGLLEKKYTLHAKFKNVSGLSTGSPVYLGGLKVGKVGELQFISPKDKNSSPLLLTELEIKKQYSSLIRQDSEASITTEGLLGDKGVFIKAGTMKTSELKGGDELLTKSSLSLEEMLEKGNGVVSQLEEITEKINDVLSSVQEQKGIVGTLIYDPESKKMLSHLNEIVDSVNGVIRDIKHGRGLLHSLIYDPSSKNVGKQLASTVENFNDMSVNLKEISRKVEEGEGSMGALVNDPTVYNDLMTLLGGANRNKLLRAVIRATIKANEKDTIQK